MDSITRKPALTWGMDDQMGQLEPGMEATFAIFDGDPLEVMGQTTLVIIKGEFIDPTERQELLRKRYKKLSKDKDTLLNR